MVFKMSPVVVSRLVPLPPLLQRVEQDPALLLRPEYAELVSPPCPFEYAKAWSSQGPVSRFSIESMLPVNALFLLLL